MQCGADDDQATASPRRIGAVAAAVLATLTIAVVVDGGPLPCEFGIVRWWQSLGGPVPSIAEFVRVTTSTESCLVASSPAAWWLVRRHRRRAVPAILIALCSVLVVQPVTKELVDRQRPTADQVEVRADHTSTSFPSGHSLSTTTTWGAASLATWRAERRRWAAVLAIPVVATGLSSSIQGVHGPSDAVAGTIIGAFAAWWMMRVVPRSGERRD